VSRIAIVLQTPRDPHSSVFLTYQALAAELERRGHPTEILTPNDFPGAGAGRWTPIVYPWKIARWMRRRRGALDLVVFHSFAGWLASASHATGPAAVAVAFHGLEPLYHQQLRIEAERTEPAAGLSARYRFLQEQLMPRFLRTACRGAARITCLNSAERDFLVARRWAPASRIVTVGHGVRDEFFLDRRIGGERPLRSLLFVAQWLPMKGIDALRNAFTQLARRHGELRLVCAGTLMPVEEVLSSFPSDVRPRVTVLPRVDQSRLTGLYRDADAFLFPSSYEGFGLALVEAMAAGLPIVTTRVGVAADALTDRRSALFIPLRDGDALAAAVEELIGNLVLRAQLGEQAHTVAHSYREADRVRHWADALTTIDRVS
jgi:glycosyltransferase involved in cell wall biosynthesis